MPRNGTGTYTLPAGNPVITQTLITSLWANTTMTDIATALTQSLTRDGQTVPTADLPMGGFKHTGVGDPTARNQYATLGYVQDGKHARLTNVAGVNQITAVLPGGATALVVGMLLQVIPAATNTGAVTLNINNIGAKPIVTQSANDLAGGNLVAGLPYVLLYDGASFIVIAGNLGAFGQSPMSGWQRPSSGTYPPITIVNPTTISVPAGVGRIIKPGSTDQSGITTVSWPTQNVVISNLASAWTTQIGVNAAGQIVQFPGGFLPTYGRDHVMLGSVTHIAGVVDGVVTRPAIFGDMIYAAYDIAAMLQNVLVAGGKMYPNGVNPFHVNIEEGVLFAVGSDPNEINSPNLLEFPTQLDIQLYPITGASGVGAITQNVPVTTYDPNGAGVITPIPGGASTATIHRLFFLSGKFLMLYGQNIYTNLDEALSQIQVDSADTVLPSRLGSATLLGYIVVQKNCANLNNPATARLVGKGGTEFSIGSAGSISEAPLDGLTYGRRNSGWVWAVPEPRGPSLTNRFIGFYTNNLLRFTEGINDTPEGGGNTGSNFEVRAYNDAGTLTGTAMAIDRATRVANFPAGLQAAGVPVVPGSYVLKAGDTMTGQLNGPAFVAGGMGVLGTNSGAGVDNSVLNFAGGKYLAYNIPGNNYKFYGNAPLVVEREVVSSVGAGAQPAFEMHENFLKRATWYYDPANNFTGLARYDDAGNYNQTAVEIGRGVNDPITFRGNVRLRRGVPVIELFSETGVNGYDIFSNVSDAVYSSLYIRNRAGAALLELTNAGEMKLNNRERIQLDVPAISNSAFSDGHLMLQTTDGSFPRIGFERQGFNAVALYYEGEDLSGPFLNLRTGGGITRSLLHTGNGVTLGTAQTITGAKTFTAITRITGQSLAFIRGGTTDARLTFEQADGTRRALIALNPTTNVLSLVAYATDGNTSMGTISIGAGGFSYNGDGAFSGDIRTYRPGESGGAAGAVLFGSSAADYLYLFDSGGGVLAFNLSRLLITIGGIRPASDNSQTCGTASFRWSTVFAAAGAINTSDEREKTKLQALTPAELAAAKDLGKLIGTYKWLQAIKDKGEAARTHIGVTAQQVIAVMAAHGLDPFAYGFVCFDKWDESVFKTPDGEETVHPAGDRYGVRYDELLAFIAAGFEARLAALEALTEK